MFYCFYLVNIRFSGINKFLILGFLIFNNICIWLFLYLSFFKIFLIVIFYEFYSVILLKNLYLVCNCKGINKVLKVYRIENEKVFKIGI